MTTTELENKATSLAAELINQNRDHLAALQFTAPEIQILKQVWQSTFAETLKTMTSGLENNQSELVCSEPLALGYTHCYRNPANCM